ncbi:MAG TPA: hypothetical protein VG253_04655, partial [Streptosporangiaceae bacterium]|nr:hypothetical protein [Streptosporangiaceae bacterium]
MAHTATVTGKAPGGHSASGEHGALGEHGAGPAAAVALADAMRKICGPADVITDPLELRTYECDGLTSHRT